MIEFSNIARVAGVRHGVTEKGDTIPECVQGEQIHKDMIKWVKDDSVDRVRGADGLATRENGLTLGVRVADCVPLLFVDPSGIVGTIHAGWRGTALEITRKAIDALRIRPFKLQLGLGPAICPDCFVVGPEVAQQFDSSVVRESEEEEGKFHVDLWEANKQHAIDAGVPERNIEIIRRCTLEDEKLYSFRGGDREDRNIAWIRQ